MTSAGEQVVLSPEDVLHIPGLGFDEIMGYSPIALEKNAIGLGIASEEFGEIMADEWNQHFMALTNTLNIFRLFMSAL